MRPTTYPHRAADLLAPLINAEAELSARETALAGALEALSQESAVKAAYQAGVDHERWRICTLIAQQLDQLSRAGTNALALRALLHRLQDA